MRTIIGVTFVAATLQGAAQTVDFIGEELARPLVAYDGKELSRQVYDIVYKRICELDRQADDTWADFVSAEDAAGRQRRVREEAIRAMGGLPERTPLNVQVTGVVQKDGYSIEKILFESRPKYYVTGHLFLPDSQKFKPPYAGVLVPCGHSRTGKIRPFYQRAGVVGAKAGLAVLVFDPADQGERFQIPTSNLVCGHGHQHSGVRAHLLGSSQAQFRLWDCMRALDVLAVRPEVDPQRLGVMGMSGGGTMTAYTAAFDERVACACPAGYITSIRDVCQECGPQDAEQVIYGQLGFGLNHLALLLMRAPKAVCPVFSHDDFFSFRGSMRTQRLAEAVYAKLGAADRIDHLEAPGPHSWYESSIVGSVAWMRRNLCGDATPFDPKSFVPLNLGYAHEESDCGIAEDSDEVQRVTKTGEVMDIPGARSIYDILRDEFHEIRAKRAPLDAAAVRRASTVRDPAELKVLAKEVSRRTADGVTAIRRVFVREDGVQFASASFLPEKPQGAPVFIVAEGQRTNQTDEVRALVAAGRAVSIMELRGRGETGSTYRRFVASFHSEKAPEEEIARMMDFLGDSLVARRSEDILIAARAFAEDVKGAKAELRATGPGAIPAAHAWYFGQGLFSGVTVTKRPHSWSEVLEDENPDYHFSNCIFGALKVYDWTELLPPAAVSEKPFDALAALPRPPKKIVRFAGGAPIRYLSNPWGFKVTHGAVEGAPEGRGAFVLDISPRGIFMTVDGEAGEKRARALLDEIVRTGEADTAIPACVITDWEGEAGDRLVLELSADENWWGLGGGWGRAMPFTATSGFAADIRVGSSGHPCASFLVSDKGRYIWCDDPVGLTVTNGTMRICSDRGKIELKDGFGDLRGAYLAAAKVHFPASGKAPDPLFFSVPQLNTWVELTYNQNQGDILAYAKAMQSNGVKPGVIMIDDTWQYAYGTWEFDPRRFADPKAMCDALHADGYKVLLWTCPFVSMDSPGYRELADCDGLKGKGGLVMNEKGVPYPVQWWNGYSAMLDMTHPEGRAWFGRQLDRLQRDFGIDGFKLDGGGIPHYAAPDMVAHDASAAPAYQSRAYGEFALKYPMSECRALFRLGGQPIVTRLTDKGHNWKELNRCVTDLLAVGICGYPFVCPDMIGDSWIAFDPVRAPHPFDEELFVRSAQVHALSPMMQFSASPWRLLSATGQAAVRKAVATRQRFAAQFVKLAEESGRTGEPMMRYMEYQFPARGYAAVKDQFMMGDFLLVAPQLVKGAATRKVEIPDGKWIADDGAEIVGPKTVTVETPLDRLPHFVRSR